MRLRIEHTTVFNYDHLISEAYTEMRLKPVDAAGQHCLSFELKTEPQGTVLQYLDHFGNDVRHFDVIQPHQRVLVSALSEVLTPTRYAPGPEQLSPLDEFNYLAPTAYVPQAGNLAELAAARVVPGDSQATVLNLMQAVHDSLVYQKGATDVSTTAEAALSLGRGVCQDFAHILLAACRLQGIPARYVSGYLYNNGNAAASHAWVDVLLPGRGWLALDPTHAREQTEQYVRVAVGRDYADVPPTRGIFKGNAHEDMQVEVSVTAL